MIDSILSKRSNYIKILQYGNFHEEGMSPNLKVPCKIKIIIKIYKEFLFF